MALTQTHRQRIVQVGRRYLGTPYDHGHTGSDWSDLSTSPRALDCSTFVCRVAIEVLGCQFDDVRPSAEWLIDNLRVIREPELGDVVGYGRALHEEDVMSLAGYDALWHVMIYAGNGMAIGACDIAGEVTLRPLDYEAKLGRRRWHFVELPSAPFRCLELADRRTCSHAT